MTSRSASLRSGEFWSLTLLATLALLLSITIIVLSAINQNLQSEVNVRQQSINQSIKLDRLNSQLIQELANVSAQNGDHQIRNLLSSHGISFTAK